MQFSTVALTALLGLASAQTVHVVSVATSNNSLVFTPDNIAVPAGDMVQFQFRAGNHSVVQSNFDNPCTPISAHTNMTGMFSGYQPVAASEAMGMIPTYTMMVASTTPMWFYCATGKHCQAGMVMVINENTAANASRSLTAFKDLAKNAVANVAPTTGTSTGTTGTTGSTGSTGSTGTGTGTAASTSPATAGASVISLSSTFGLLAAAAALLIL
ncbi:Cupredoxin [Xylariales sp. AK1849]|nr:Cupredoxin [Xylariales sp. AK1849]